MPVTITTIDPALPQSENVPFFPSVIPSPNVATVDALCHILARVILRLNAEQQAQTAVAEEGAQ